MYVYVLVQTGGGRDMAKSTVQDGIRYDMMRSRNGVTEIYSNKNRG
jgi:hypothetical protein